MRKIPELVCPAGNLPTLKATMDNGADTVYMGLKDATNARNFPGSNFDMKSAREGVAYAHACGRNVLMAINTFVQVGQVTRWHAAVDTAVELNADAVIVADPAVMACVAERYPNPRLHMSVQGSATSYEVINMMKELFGVRRVVLSRVLTVDQAKHVIDHTDVGIEVFGFGNLCVIVEGRCILSSYTTGESPNTQSACSPAKVACWEQLPDRTNVRLNQVLIDQYKPDEPAGYSTLCRGHSEANDEAHYALEEPTSLNVLEILSELIKIGVSAIKIEDRQCNPTYTAQVIEPLRQALDAAAADPVHLEVNPVWNNALSKVPEGHQTTLGAYNRPWKQGGGKMNPMKLSLGPVLFFWQKEALLGFYAVMLDAPVDTIYLGEVARSCRQKMHSADRVSLAEDLAGSGKEIILPSQVLLGSEFDLKRLRKITGQDKFKVETNDMGMVKLVREHGIPFVVGASLNIYSESTLALFQKLGAYRRIASSELSRDEVAEIIKVSDDIEMELFAWGKMPLAYSSRRSAV